MKDLHTSAPDPDSAEDTMATRFAHLVVQQSSMAMMLLGKTAHPETGEVLRDLDGARFFIDQLEMLEAKTKGNLSEHEAALLKQTLMSLRMAFVESVNSPPPSAEPGAQPAAAPASPAPAATAAASSENDSHKKFSKKY